MDGNECSYLMICNHQNVDVLGVCGEKGGTYKAHETDAPERLSTMPPIIDTDVKHDVKHEYFEKLRR
jgi:hypothetical protein